MDMAFISLMHWHATGTFEQATYDQAIQALATTIRAFWLRRDFALQHYACRPTVENVVCKDVGIKWSVGADTEISNPWRRHWTLKIESPGVVDVRKNIA